MLTYSNKVLRYIYFSSPNIIKNLLASVYGLIQRKERYGVFFNQYLKFLKESQWWDNSKLIEYRDSKTLNFIKYAIRSTEFYRNWNEIDNISEIKKLPIIDKQIVRSHYREIIPKDINKFKIRMSHTSGTTGSALIFPLTIECFQREYAFRAIHYSWSGVDLTKKPKIVTLSGHPVAHPDVKKPPFWVYDYVNNWLLFSSYHLSDNLMKYYVNELEKFNPELIHGYPSSVYLISKAYKKYGRNKLKNLKAIYVASETLFENQRKEIEEVFQVKVFNWYGNSEMCANIVECEKGRLHLKYEHSFVEILNENNEDCNPGEKGRLICTGFGNLAFPLIRYDIRDEVIISNEKECPCGRGGLIIKEILGRVEDYIFTPTGRRIGRLDHLFKDTMGIKEAQIYQEKIDEIEIRVVFENRKLKNDNIKILLDECNLRFGNELKVRIIEVDSIPKGSNGKFKFVINKLMDSKVE